MTVLIQLTTAGFDTGPFNLYSDVDSFGIPFETGVTKGDLLAGYISTIVPVGTTTVRVCSTSLYCSNCIDIPISPNTLDFTLNYTCSLGLPDLTACCAVNGTGPYSFGSTYFADEASALANSSWVVTGSLSYTTVPSNGTWWVVCKDSLGAIVAKSVTTSC